MSTDEESKPSRCMFSTNGHLVERAVQGAVFAQVRQRPHGEEDNNVSSHRESQRHLGEADYKNSLTRTRYAASRNGFLE